jgi:hypothetical protein
MFVSWSPCHVQVHCSWKGCYPERKNGECHVQRKTFYRLIPRIYVAKGIKNIFRELMLDSSSSIVSAFEDIFSYPNVSMYSFLLNRQQWTWLNVAEDLNL